MNIFKLIFLLLTFYNFLSSNENISITKDTDYKEILSSSDIFIDHTNNLTLKDIKTKKFTSNELQTLSYGYSPTFTVWIKFTIKNDTNQDVKKVLEYANPLTTHISFFDNNSVYKDGLYQLNYQRNSLNPIFTISLKPNETKTYYIKASSYIATLIIKLNLWDKKVFDKQVQKHNMILAMFFASMLILTLYNLFIYFFTKDKNYLFYILYMVGIIAHQLVYTAFGNIYLFTQELTVLIVQNAALIVAFPVFMFALLVRSFLKLLKYPKWNKVINIYMVVFLFFTSMHLITDSLNQYRNISTVILLMLLISVTIYASIKKNRQAYFVLFGWSMFVIAVICMYLSSAGIINLFEDFRYFAEIALVLEALIFSIALADKINQLEMKKNEASMELILNQQFEKQRLENQVNKQTAQLTLAYNEKSLLLKELNHRVKNNMQTIISLIRLQSNDISDTKTKEMFTTIQNRINAMSGVHELLYNQNDISHINAYEYLEKLIDELMMSFQTNGIKIKFDIKTKIKAEQAVYCGLIVNELVTNSFKYAFINHKGNIDIKLEKQLGNYILTFCDDGIGYDEKTTKENLGLTLIDTLVKKQLKGKIIRDTINGVKAIITWS